MKILFPVMAVTLLFAASCGFLGVADVLDKDIPDPWPISINNAHYKASVSFSGNPDTDFGTSKTKGDTSEFDVIYGDGSPYHDITKVYIAYNPQGLYLGLYTEALDPVDGQNMGNVFFMIDNGITNTATQSWNGLTNGGCDVGSFVAASDTALALDGTVVSVQWDLPGSAVVGDALAAGRKISCVVQQWRPGPSATEVKFWPFYVPGVTTPANGGAGLIKLSSSSPTNITEIFVPWAMVLGTTNTNYMPNQIYLAVKTQPGIAGTPSGVDVWPNDGGDDDPSLLSKEAEWYKILIK